MSHWIKLILSQNILLPEYQRSFVWTKKQVERFLKNLKEGVFVPPVIIGALKKNDRHENLIIDGQQRLTSLLLGVLGAYPKLEAFPQGFDEVDNGDDMNIVSDPEDTEDDAILGWTLKKLIPNSPTISYHDINPAPDKYEQLDVSAKLDDDFLNKTFLGFSYIVLEGSELKQQKFYSTVFHDLNLQGVALQGPESRRSLYYLNKDLISYFDPDFCKMIKIKPTNARIKQYDYVRALALLSEYAKNTCIHCVAKGCRNQEKLELYYEDYILAVVNNTDDRFAKFSEFVGGENIKPRAEQMGKYILDLGFNTPFKTIVEADVKLFGLIYYIILKGELLKSNSFGNLKESLNNKISTYEETKAPNALGALRARIKDSIEIYSHYIHE